jgi:hypothetical protein
MGLVRSPIKGPSGNIEFLAWLRPGGEGVSPDDLVMRELGDPMV